ncbi:hypothetical protein C8F01DRAFT_319426 [Mycena amicta]|nr:hypothetical protein C8F01DRAFT_319426 [Mycena amicta]
MPVSSLPCELEREILELAAETWSQDIPKLLLIAHRVHIWLEPFLYRTVHLRQVLDQSQEAFLKAASSKPPAFLGKGVRRVIVDFTDGEFTPERLDQFTAALQHCTTITAFAINRNEEKHSIPAQIFSLLASVHLDFLGGFLSLLMPAPLPMDALQPRFRSLSHLEVFDKNIEADPRLLPFVKALPALTHLALESWTATDTMRALLQKDGCEHLKILVVLLPMGWDHEIPDFNRIGNSIGNALQDGRVVTTYSHEWAEGSTLQGSSYWSRAQVFLEQKHRDLVPGFVFWME